MIAFSLFVAETGNMGRGVFTAEDLDAFMVIEVSPVIVIDASDRKLLDQTLLHDYIFEWGGSGKQCCMALGYVALYNHSYSSNCEYEMHYSDRLITIKTMRPVRKGEELFINYNGTWNNPKKVWFDKSR